MKAVVYNGPRDVAVTDVDDARIERASDAIVRITTTNICGSDLHRRAEESAAALLPVDPGVRIDIDVDDRDPRDLLVAASSEVDVLVCGSRCYGPHPATLRGGVTRHVTAEAACPVIVMARSPDVRFEELVGD